MLGQVLNNSNADTINITFFGSEAVDTSEDGTLTWPQLLEEELELDTIQVETNVITVGKKSTRDVLDSSELDLLLESEADIVFVESLTLNDNSFALPIEESEENLTYILEELTDVSPQSEIILLPSNPVPTPNYYQRQIDSLNDFGEETFVNYANHWNEWPNFTIEDLDGYVEKGIPTEEGHQLLADYMMNFITE
ncbi:SGNH/GDSL hydrolase family protein [Alkalicoccobacillus porphyridii]|uniref:SGNH/GDSL hydrolase family protein n=1 Tax=Alkalicoccobacillus porphyridii TaxID=2597270 RepID=A0A554A3Y4_9BACI|nr:SGNH/GDSL hydrolase family protein [Alkalicoccobacillus porphyridii]TSB48388.1 SGNH/GDSL hydrolase family protein [Alkalicoccobacillus porphyridii]